MTCLHCDHPVSARGLCHAHYERQRLGRDMHAPLARTVEERFWARVDKTGTCWLWTGAKGGDGRYGLFQSQNAHRWAYKHFVGPIPEGLVLDHLCRVTQCVNPAHLEPVTQTENILRGTAPAAINARKTHCIRGHELTPENVRIQRNGGRACRVCASERYFRERAEARAQFAEERAS